MAAPTTGPTLSPTPTPTPTPTPGPTAPAAKASARVVARAAGRVSHDATLKVRVKLLAGTGGDVAGRVELRRGGKVLARLAVPSGQQQTVRVSVRGKKLARLANRRGVVRLVAVFGGNALTEAASSPQFSVRLR